MPRSHTEDDIITPHSLHQCTLLIKLLKILLAIFQTCGTMWNMFNKKLILFPLIYLCWCWNYMHSTSPGHGCWEQHNWRSNHLSPPLTLQSAVGSFSFISVSLLSWRHYLQYLCCGELRFNQGLLGNTWDNISTIYGYVSLWNGNIIVIVCGQFSWPWCSTLEKSSNNMFWYLSYLQCKIILFK